MKTTLQSQLEQKYSAMKLHRSQWDDLFQDVNDYVRPYSPSSQAQELTRGKPRNEKIHDSTAVWALEQFSNGLSSFLTNPMERWFLLGLEGISFMELPRPLRIYLERVSDIIFSIYSLPQSNHMTSLHETYLDVGGYGTGIIYQEAGKDTPLHFQSFPLTDCFIAENSRGVIDTVFRRSFWTRRVLLQAFPKAIENKKVEKAKDDETFEIVHACMPRTDGKPDALKSVRKPFGCYFFGLDFDDVLEESGSNELVYHVPRWLKMAGEIYGRSPVMPIMHDIKKVNVMWKELLYSAQLANRPPMVFDEDSMLLNVDSLVPNAILWKYAGSEMPQAIQTQMQPNLTLEMIQQIHEQINRALYLDFLFRPKKKERQTAVEVMDDRGEMLRQMTPMLGRMESELCTPMLERTYRLLLKKKLIPAPPAEAREFSSVPFSISYISPAAKAQLGTKAAANSALLQDLGAIGQFKPDIFDYLEPVELLEQLSIQRDASPKILKDRKQVEAMRKQKEQAEAAQLGAQAAPQVAGAMKDIAQARRDDPSLLQGML